MRRLFAAALVALAGCTGNFNWRTVKANPAPPRFAVAPDGSTWAFGGLGVWHRSTGGTWTNVNICGPYSTRHDYDSADLAFSGGITWALCATNGGRVLLRYEGGNATLMTIPKYTDFSLVQLDGDIALLSDTSVYKHDGNSFTVFAPAPPKTLIPAAAAGRSLTDLYVGQVPEMQHWNGTAWLPMGRPADRTLNPGTPIFREGQVFAGNTRLVGEQFLPVVTNNPGLARGVAFFAVAGADSAIFIGRPDTGSAEFGSDTAFFWYGKSGEADLTFLGDGPFLSGSLYVAGGQSGFAIDDHTLLVVNSRSATTNELLEGVR